MTWTYENRVRAILGQISRENEASASSVCYEFVNHFSLDFLEYLGEYSDAIAESVEQLYARTPISIGSRRIWIEGALRLLRLIQEGKCRCEILTELPACPHNLEKSGHLKSIVGIQFLYEVSEVGQYACAYCGRSFTVSKQARSSRTTWSLKK